jgi:hypothetical protein
MIQIKTWQKCCRNAHVHSDEGKGGAPSFSVDDYEKLADRAEQRASGERPTAAA